MLLGFSILFYGGVVARQGVDFQDFFIHTSIGFNFFFFLVKWIYRSIKLMNLSFNLKKILPFYSCDFKLL
jgi:hypothetical protein